MSTQKSSIVNKENKVKASERHTDTLSGNHVLWFYLLFMALAAWQLLFHTQVQTDMSAFMPKAQNQEQQLLLQQLAEGPAARLWMLALSHASSEVLADVSVKLAQKANNSPLVNHVINGGMVLDKTTQERLFEYRYLLSDRITSESFGHQRLQQIFTELLQVLRSPLSTFSKQLSQSDPSGEFLHLLRSFDATGSSSPAVKHGVWFNEQGDQALLFLQSNASGTDLEAQLELRQRMKHWLTELTKDDAASDSIILKMGGVPLISLETREHIRQTSQRLSIAATLLMLMFIFFVYRQPRKVLLTALPLLTGALMGAACVSWFFGALHGITLAFGITLLGVAVDYPIHLFSHQRSEENFEQTAVRIWPTLSLSVLSTLLGFSAMLWTDFPGLAQLGLFSISGLLTSVLVTRYLLPVLAGGLSASKPVFSGLARGLQQQVNGKIKLLLSLLLIVILGWIIQGNDLWSRDIQELSPVSPDVRLADQQMRKVMGAPEPGHVMLLTANLVQQLLEKQEQLQPLLAEAIEQGYIQGADYAARILPSEKTQLQRRSWIPQQNELAENIETGLKNLPFKTDGFDPYLDALQHSRQLPPMTLKMLGESVLVLRINSLKQQTEHGVNGLIQLVDLQDASALADLLKVSSRNDLWLLDIPRETSNLVDQFRQEVTAKAMIALILIGLLAALWLRNPMRWLKVMTPVLLSVAVSVSVVLVTGAKLNLFHLVSLLLVAGIGLDYALFFSRPHTGSDDWKQTAYALMVCCISTVVIFSLLAASDIPVLHAIGLTVASGALSAFCLSWLISRETRNPI